MTSIPVRLGAPLLALGLLASACSNSPRAATTPSGPTRSGPSPSAGGPACDDAGGPSTAPSPPAPATPSTPATIDELAAGATALTLLDTGTATTPGRQAFGFDLTSSSGGLLQNGNPLVWLARDRTSRAIGPFVAQWFPFTAYPKCHDRSPLSPLPGAYTARIDVPSVGQWFVAVEVAGQGGKAVAVGDPNAKPPTGIPVTDGPLPAQLGSKAVSVRTPVATTEHGLREIDTRNPPSPLHAISLDHALRSGKPTVVVFSTPLLCQSRLCGPVTDEVLLASEQVGTSRANFIHVEEFLPGPDLTPPAPTFENRSPAFKAWGFESEPWTVVIDAKGIIRARWEGPVTAPQIEAALLPLLS